MAPASTLAYGTVVGQFLVSASDSTDADALPDAVPASGTVTFTPSAGVVLDYSLEPNPSAILRKPIVATLDAEGYLTGPNGVRGVQLIATDNPTVKPIGWTWVATYALTDDEGEPLRTLTTQPFLVPSGITTDLIEAMPIGESKGVLITKGDKGDLTTITIGDISVGEPSVTVTETGQESELSIVLPVTQLTAGAVTTADVTTPASATITGSYPEQTIDFTIPRGLTGDQGDPGDMVDVAGPAPVTGAINVTTAMLPSTRIWNLTGDVTLTLPTPVSTKSATITLILTQDATGNRVITWPAGIKWPQGIVQQPATAGGSTSIIHLLWSGAQWYGLLGGKSFA